MSDRKKLFDLLLERSFLFREDGFRLSSGKISPYYLDCKKTTLCSKALPLVGKLLWTAIEDLEIEAVGGLAIGADPLVAAVCFQAGLEGKNLEGFVVRKESKVYGTKQWLEGKVFAGMRCVILEDVVTTGASSLKAAQKALEAGLQVQAVVTLVDRDEGGREAIRKEGLDFRAIFHIEEFLAKRGITI